jgi:hypothetical protein
MREVMDKNHIFKLVEVYESPIEIGGWLKFIRIELLESTKERNFLRARVWLDENYNLYPSALNTDTNGGNIQSLHSADAINREITAILPFGEDLIRGKVYLSREDFVSKLFTQVEMLYKSK